MLNEIKLFLNSEASDKVGDFNLRLIKTKYPILGVKIPVLRKYAKKIISSDFRSFLQEADQSSYEMVLLEAFVIAGAKIELEERLSYIDSFIPKIDNWSVHDSFISSLKCTKKHPKEMFDYLLKYVNSKKEYEVRFVAIMLMSYYINDEYIDRNLEIVRKLNANAYYSKMGVAWFLATAAASYPDKIYNYLLNEMDKEIVKMAVRKIRDSYRISNEYKDKVFTFCNRY